MASFRRGNADADNPSWRQWSRGDADRFDESLDVDESDLVDFGDSATRGFEESWADEVDDEASDGDVHDILAPSRDVEEGSTRANRRTERLRDVDGGRRWPRVVGVIALFVAAGVGTYLFLDTPSADTNDESAGPGSSDALVAPEAPRTYTDATGVYRVATPWVLDERFRAAGPDGLPEPDSSTAPTLPSPSHAAAVLWGGRAHIAVVGDGVGADGLCVVATLMSASYDVVDLGAAGECDERYAATGDRVACRSENVVLIEVWPENPSAAVSSPPIGQVRVRVERNDQNALVSIRTTAGVAGTESLTAQELAGRPGESVQIVLGDYSASCELLDRSGVQVQLL